MKFQEWQKFARDIRKRAEILQDSKHEEARELATLNGLDYMCIHNAAIDTDLRGWCKDSPEKLRIAKKVNHILSDFSICNLADRIIDRAWKNVVR